MEFISECFQPYNALFTVFVLACVCYWIMVVGGFFGVETLDFDVDVDVDLDGAVDGSADATDLGSVGLIGGFMRFMHFHEVPFMIVATIVSTVTWILVCLLNLYWNTGQSWSFALMAVVPTLIASLAISKILLQPFVVLFRNVDVPEKKLKDYVGEECLVQTSEVTKTFGQAEISTHESPIVIQIRNLTAFKFGRGDRAVLDNYNSAGKYFEVRPVEKKPTEA